MDELKHGDYAEEGWRRVNEYLRREDNNLRASLKITLFMLPAEKNKNTGENAETNATVYVFKLLHSRTHARVCRRYVKNQL